MLKIQAAIENWRNNVLARLCDKCKGYCCQDNITDLTEEQIKLIFGSLEPPLNSWGKRTFLN